MEHPIGNFITSLKVFEAKHPQGSFTITAVITSQKVFMKHLCFYSGLLATIEWETLAVENMGESTNKTDGETYFGKLTQYTKNAESLNKFLPRAVSNLNDTK